jgi:hypothetical protein
MSELEVPIQCRGRDGAYRKGGTHLIGDIFGHALGQPIVGEYEIQEITAFYIFQNEVYKFQLRQRSACNTAQIK